MSLTAIVTLYILYSYNCKWIIIETGNSKGRDRVHPWMVQEREGMGSGGKGRGTFRPMECRLRERRSVCRGLTAVRDRPSTDAGGTALAAGGVCPAPPELRLYTRASSMCLRSTSTSGQHGQVREVPMVPSRLREVAQQWECPQGEGDGSLPQGEFQGVVQDPGESSVLSAQPR